VLDPGRIHGVGAGRSRFADSGLERWDSRPRPAVLGGHGAGSRHPRPGGAAL